jgi:hypothetical protein
MSTDMQTLLPSDDAAPEKHRKKSHKKKKSKKSKKSKKHGSSTIKMNCFDQEEEDDGALDIFGNPDPRFATEKDSDGDLDETRHKEKVIEMPEQTPPEAVPDVPAPTPDRTKNNSMLANMLEGDSANSSANYDIEKEEMMTVRSYEPSGSYTNRGFLHRVRGLSNRSLDGRSGDQGANGGVSRQASSRGRRISSGSHSRRRLSLTRKERKERTSQSTPNLKTPPLKQREVAVQHNDESGRSGATALDISERVERGTEASEDTAATTPVEEKGIEITERTTAIKMKDGVVPMQKAAAAAAASESKPLTTRQRRRSLSLRSSRGGRPSMQRASSTSALMHTQQPPRKKSILKKEDSSRRRTKLQASVRFDRVETREFDRTISDNPSVSCGIPIGLDWKYNPDTNIQDLEEYEDNRAPRRLREQLALTPSARECMLLKDWGVTFRELHQVNQENDCIRQKRWESATQTVQQARVEELLETTKRRVGRVMTGTSKRKQQERLWKNAQVGREPIDP